MKKRLTVSLLLAVMMSFSVSLMATCEIQKNDAVDIPIIQQDHWKKVGDVAHYRMADWSQVIGRAEGISVKEAKEIADRDPDITYFFYVKGWQLCLENLEAKPAIWRVFNKGDAVFFTGAPWWGSAPGLADGYVKQEF